MRLGVFGGSFDPVHYGHLLLAETCREQCKLDQILLIPAALSPHKRDKQGTPAKHRVEMLRLAIAGHEYLHVSTIEIERGGVSYTVDTLKTLAEQHSNATLFFLMGADSLIELCTWREPKQICELAIPLVVRRAGSAEPSFEALADLVGADRLTTIRQQQVEMPIVELSSTDIRERVSDGKSIRFQTPRAVEKYIETNRLYSMAKKPS